MTVQRSLADHFRQKSPFTGNALRLTVLFSAVFVFIASILFAFLLFGDYIGVSNIRDPWHSLASDYFAGVTAAILLAVLVFCAPLSSHRRAALLVLWAAKCGVALGLMLVYEAQYELLDAFGYHEAAASAYVRIGDLNWGDGTELLVWSLQIVYDVFPASYHLAKVLFSFLGLVGIYLTWRAAVGFIGVDRPHHLLLLGFVPSFLFWSSTLGKEPVFVFLVGMFVLGLSRLHRDRPFSGLLLAVAAAGLASLVRLWMGAILILPTLAVLLAYRRREWKPQFLALGMGAAAVGAVLLGAAVERFGGDTAGLLHSVDTIARSWEEGGSAQSAPEFGSIWNVLVFAPIGAFTALFRPLPGEVGGVFGLAAGLENALLLGAFVLGLSRARFAQLTSSSVLMLAGVLVMWAAVYGFISYQNLGTASRFKAQIFPAMLLLVVLLWQRVPVHELVRSKKVFGHLPL